MTDGSSSKPLSSLMRTGADNWGSALLVEAVSFWLGHKITIKRSVNRKIRLCDFIFPPRWILHSQPIGLDGEEIETVCELKGLSLRRAEQGVKKRRRLLF